MTFRVGDRVTASVERLAEHAKHIRILCPGVVTFLGKGWIGVRYELGGYQFRGGFWPEEVTPRA